MSEGKKFDQGKPQLGLLPWEALIEVANVLTFGRLKYGAHNWRNGMSWSRLADAAYRHLASWMMRDNKDPETGRSHLAHAICCLLFLLTYELLGLGTDDRWSKPDEVETK